MKKCNFVIHANGKLICKTHDQALVYVYVTPQGISIVCQVGEDELATERMRQKKGSGKETKQ